jgi:hypothetical protein
MVSAFAQRLGVTTERIAMVGDTLHDLDAARAAGAVAVAVLSGPVGREVLEPHADYVIADISALPALAARLMGVESPPLKGSAKSVQRTNDLKALGAKKRNFSASL